MAQLQGTWDPRFDAVAETLSSSLDAGTDVGASVAVALDGELVVDIWGGTSTRQARRHGSGTPSPTSGRPPRP